MINYRISTSAQHAYGIAEILKQQTQLAKTQVQVASGERFQTPAEDPVAAVRVLGIERAQSQLEQYGRNAGMAQDRLSLGEQSLTDLGTLLQRVHELVVKANNGTLDDVSLGSIATELHSKRQELLDIANRQDSNGEYLFAGYSTGTRPFADTGTGVGYAGDQGVRQLQISSSQKIPDGFHGQRVFMDIQEGNGTFVVDPGTNSVSLGANTGSAIVGAGQLLDATAWAAAAADFAAALPPLPHEYTVHFTDQTLPADGVVDTWELLDANGGPVLAADNVTPITGSYTDGGAIAFHGVQFVVSGQPAVGDSLTVRPAGTESLFKTLDDLIGALEAGTGSTADQARLGSRLNRALEQMDHGLNHVIDLRTEIGARLGALDTAADMREEVGIQAASALSDLKDVDFAEAISRLNQQLTGLQAAQAAYTRIGQLSLFDYMR
jgi:flagellar hook-associated protein 3 FlgL